MRFNVWETTRSFFADTGKEMQVFSIIDFVTNEDSLATMIDFDPEAFFETVLRLFTGDPWRFITNQGKYKF